MGVTYTIFDILTECYSKLLLTNFATSPPLSSIFYESISIDVSKKVFVILCNLWICGKNVASSRSHYLYISSVLPCMLFELNLAFGKLQLQSNSVINFDQSLKF